MERWRVRVFELLLLMTPVGVGGCHLSWPLDGAATSVNHVEFMSLWKTYTHCRSSSDPDEMRADTEQLHRAAQALTGNTHAPPLVPDFLHTLIAEPPSRLAADPKAMVMACTLYTGQTAHTQGLPALAREMFQSILTAMPGPDYAQYVMQASRGLVELQQDRQFVMDAHEHSVHVVSR